MLIWPSIGSKFCLEYLVLYLCKIYIYMEQGPIYFVFVCVDMIWYDTFDDDGDNDIDFEHYDHLNRVCNAKSRRLKTNAWTSHKIRFGGSSDFHLGWWLYLYIIETE